MAIIIRNADGSTSELGLSGAALGIGTTQVARQLEVVEVILTRLVPDGPGPAAAFSAHEGGLASLWTNPSYTTEAPTSGFVRTINMKNGNVGIGSSKDAKALDPEEKLVVVGNILATGDVKLEGSDCAEDFDVHDLATLEPGMVVVRW